MSEVIRVWSISLQVPERTVAAYSQCLSEDEQTRAARFRFDADRRRFVVARGVLRHLLAERLGNEAIALSFAYGEYGKPRTTTTKTNYHFNLSHSGEIALCALGGDRIVGVDIEKVKPIKRLGSMIDRCLVDAEKAQLLSLPICQQDHNFLQYWTCKEAYLKAIGLGLSQSMTTVEVDLRSPCLVAVPQRRAAGWQLQILDLPEGYVGALVVARRSMAENPAEKSTIEKLKIEMKCWQHPNSLKE